MHFGVHPSEHRDDRSAGCTIAALSGDAARQSADIRATFAVGIESSLAAFQRAGITAGDSNQDEVRANLIGTLAQMVGALVLSRACPDDSPVADEILTVCRQQILVMDSNPAAVLQALQ